MKTKLSIVLCDRFNLPYYCPYTVQIFGCQKLLVIRYNHHETAPYDLPRYAQDGEVTNEKRSDGSYDWFYFAGPKVIAWFEKKDREYLTHLSTQSIDLFLEEMTPVKTIMVLAKAWTLN